MSGIAALLFDKDGTIFDFRATWADWTAGFIRDLARDDTHAAEIAAAMRYDLDQHGYLPDSPFIAGSIDEWITTILPILPDHDRDSLRRHIIVTTAVVRQVPPVPLIPLFDGLRGYGLPMGVATNDGITPVTRQLEDNDIAGYFDFIAGYDSGFGAKPGPGMLLAFADAAGVPPAQVAMIGDSLHDMEAASNAGMVRVAVLTGMATEADLAPHCDVVLGSIADLPDWLDSVNATPQMSQTDRTPPAATD